MLLFKCVDYKGGFLLHIETLDEKTIKLVLSSRDMAGLGITYEEMDYQNPQTRRVVRQLLEEIRLQTGADCSSGKLFIEAFPYADGGCILYLNLLEQTGRNASKHSFDTPLIFAFPEAETLAQLCCRLNRHFGHAILKTSLYSHQGQYLLLVYTYFRMDREIRRLLEEYGQFYGKGAVCSAAVKEHGTLLLEEDAMQQFARYLSPPGEALS